MSRIIHTLNMFDKVKNLPGDVIECGVAAGTITFPLAAVMSEFTPKKVLYACDTYKGLPYNDQVKNGYEMKKGECNYGNTFKEIFKIHPHRSNVQMVEGLVEDTLESHLKDKMFCFAWLDMDCYQPTSYSYKFLEDRMVLGGIIGFHDYQFHRCPGIARIVEEEVDYKKYQNVFCQHNCVYIQRYA